MRYRLIVLLTFCVTGCATQVSTDPHPWTDKPFNNNPDEFHFAIVGDRTGRHRPGVFEKGLAKLNLLHPEFVMSVGDLIEGYTKDEVEIDQQWDEIEGSTSKLEAPFFYVPGNHDMSNPIQARKWSERFGRAYYHFVYKNVLFLCLNTYDPEQHISPQQIEYVANALKQNPSVRWTCVFMHEPLWDYDKPTGWEQVESLLQDRPYTVFAGHYHTYTKYVRHDRRYIVLATTGGGFKDGLSSPELGSFDHVTWVTMLPQGPRIANIELDAIHDEDVRTEAMGKLIDRVLNGEVLKISPVLTLQDTLERASVTLTFANDSDVPMNASGTLPAQGVLHATPESFDVTLPPKSVQSVSLELATDRAVPVNDLSPMSVKWSATYQPAGRTPVKVPREDLLAVERVLPCVTRTAPVVVDGNLDEWGTFPFAFDPARASPPAQWSGPGDSSYQFAVEHDEQYVYIAVKTTDDHSILNSKKEPWSQDGVEVRFDARPEPQRSQGRGHGEFKDILVVSMSPAGSAEQKMVLYSADQLPPGLKAVCVKTPAGHAAEIAIPASYLNERQAGHWQQFRLNVAVDDYDEVAGPLKALWWRPDWRHGQTYAGSGTFERR